MFNPRRPVRPAVEPEHVTVQHILIGFEGSVPGRPVTRTPEEAENLAESLLAAAWLGEDFDELLATYTDDSAPGIFSISNHGITPRADEYRRSHIIPSFGDVAFSISVGNIDLVRHDPEKSPYGWHIIKRLE